MSLNPIFLAALTNGDVALFPEPGEQCQGVEASYGWRMKQGYSMYIDQQVTMWPYVQALGEAHASDDDTSLAPLSNIQAVTPHRCCPLRLLERSDCSCLEPC